MAKRKNTYLHKCLENIEPTSINRSVCKGKQFHFSILHDNKEYTYIAMEQPITDLRDMGEPLLPPSSLQSNSYGLKLDKTKAEAAYGLWGIPKLVKKHKDTNFIELISKIKMFHRLKNWVIMTE